MRSSIDGRPSLAPRRPGTIVAIAVGVMAALAIVYGLRLLVSQPRVASNAEPEPSAVASIAAGGERPTTIIVSTPNRNDCRRYQLNVETGVKNDQGSINCTADNGKQPGRLEAISKAFRNR
jgi:hypothetical protein